MSFCNKCGKEIKEEDEFCPNCGTKIEAPHKIDSPMSVAGQAKLEGVKQRIAEYNREYIGCMILMFGCIIGGGFFWGLNFRVGPILLWIISILCLVLTGYYRDKVTKSRKKLEKGKID